MSGQSFILVQNPNAEQESPSRRAEDRHRATPDGQADSEYPTQKRPADASGFIATPEWVGIHLFYCVQFLLSVTFNLYCVMLKGYCLPVVDEPFLAVGLHLQIMLLEFYFI